MQEIVTKAVVLDRFTTGESNSLVILYTQDLGLIKASAKSSRSLKSKLSGHLEPLTLAQVRLVKKNQFTIVDALAIKNFSSLLGRSQVSHAQTLQRQRELLSIFKFIAQSAALEQPDQELWMLLEQGKVFTKDILKVLGLDPAHAICNQCEAPNPTHFLINEGYYLCAKCFSPGAAKIMLK